MAELADFESRQVWAEAGGLARRCQPENLAYLTGRVRVKERRPQLSVPSTTRASTTGGSVIAGADGRITYLLPVVDALDRLDERRAAAGLGPWRDYERRMAKLQDRTPQERPRPGDGSLPVEAAR